MPRRSRSSSILEDRLSAVARLSFEFHDPTTLDRQGNDSLGRVWIRHLSPATNKTGRGGPVVDVEAFRPLTGQSGDRVVAGQRFLGGLSPVHQDALERSARWLHIPTPSRAQFPIRAKSGIGALEAAALLTLLGGSAIDRGLRPSRRQRHRNHANCIARFGRCLSRRSAHRLHGLLTALVAPLLVLLRHPAYGADMHSVRAVLHSPEDRERHHAHR